MRLIDADVLWEEFGILYHQNNGNVTWNDAQRHVCHYQNRMQKGEPMSDMISRKALCEYALNQKDKSITPNDIMRFPSAQPETHEERTETHACDLISRQAAIDAIVAQTIGYNTADEIKAECDENIFNENGYLGGLKDAIEAIEDMPSAQTVGTPLHYNGSDYSHGFADGYKNGLKDAESEIVRCKDCTFYRSDGCFFSTAEIEEDGFCSWAERRTDG